MEVSQVYLVMSVAGAAGLFAVWFIMSRVRPWEFPVRGTSFDIARTEGVEERMRDRGPDGKEGGEKEADPVDRGDQTLWQKLKLELYTYQKRPGKVRK